MTAIGSTRVLIVDDHAMFRAGLSLVINASIRNSIVLEAESVEAAMHGADGTPDVVLLDIQLKGLNGLEGLALIKRRWPQTPVLVLSGQDESRVQRMALERGAAGFISKAEPAHAIVQAIQRIAQGAFEYSCPPQDAVPQARLTPRQCEILDFMNLGLSNKQIANKLAVSDNTVRRHVQDILQFFNAASRTEAVFAARDKGLIG